MKKYFSFGLIIISAIMWGIISLFSKPLMNMGFNSMQLVFMRGLISCISLGIFILIINPSLFKIKLKDLPLFIAGGILSFTLCIACYMGSIDQNGAGVAGMLMYTSPIWAVIISAFLFKEKIGLFKIIALIGVIAGVVMVSLGGELKITLTGALLGIGSGIGCSFITIFSKLSSNKGYSPLTLQFYVFTTALIVSFPFASGWEIPEMISVDYMSLLYFALISIVSTVVPYVIYSFAMKKVSASTGGILASLEVVVCALTGFIAYDENIGVVGVAGIVVMLAALVFLSLYGDKPLKLKTTE